DSPGPVECPCGPLVVADQPGPALRRRQPQRLADRLPAGLRRQAQRPPGLGEAHLGAEHALPLNGAAVAGAGVVSLVPLQKALLHGVVLLHLKRLLAAGQAELCQVLAVPADAPARTTAAPMKFRGVLADDVDPVARLGLDLGAVDPLVGSGHVASSNT